MNFIKVFIKNLLQEQMYHAEEYILKRVQFYLALSFVKNFLISLVTLSVFTTLLTLSLYFNEIITRTVLNSFLFMTIPTLIVSIIAVITFARAPKRQLSSQNHDRAEPAYHLEDLAQDIKLIIATFRSPTNTNDSAREKNKQEMDETLLKVAAAIEALDAKIESVKQQSNAS